MDKEDEKTETVEQVRIGVGAEAGQDASRGN
jgi:hypothetical protein